VVRPTRGLAESGHENAGPVDYLLLAVRLGARGLVGLATRFALAVVTLLGIWRDHASEGARRVRAQHDRRMAELAAFLDVGLDRLRALASLHRAPITQNFRSLAFILMLDKIALGLAGGVAIAFAFVLAPRLHIALGWAVGIALLVVGVSFLLSRSRKDIEPSSELRDGAMRVARLFPAAFVVMGHTHLPEVRTAPGAPCTYVNLGAWANADGVDGGAAGVSSRTHFVLTDAGDGRSVAELRVWDAEMGPRKFISVSGLSVFPAAPASKSDRAA
jgi:hypothetical protein